jgi:hypothetical protein
MNWIKENWFKISLLILIIIILICLSLFISNQNKRENLSNNIKCQQEGMNLHEIENKELKENFFGIRNEMPEFKFSKELNTCLYKAIQISKAPGNSYLFYFITDVYKNKQLAAHLTFTNDDVNKESSEMFSDEDYKNFERKYFK